MNTNELYITWSLLFLLLVAAGAIIRSIEHLREEIEELRQYVAGEKTDDLN